MFCSQGRVGKVSPRALEYVGAGVQNDTAVACTFDCIQRSTVEIHRLGGQQ